MKKIVILLFVLALPQLILSSDLRINRVDPKNSNAFIMKDPKNNQEYSYSKEELVRLVLTYPELREPALREMRYRGLPTDQTLKPSGEALNKMKKDKTKKFKIDNVTDNTDDFKKGYNDAAEELFNLRYEFEAGFRTLHASRVEKRS